MDRHEMSSTDPVYTVFEECQNSRFGEFTNLVGIYQTPEAATKMLYYLSEEGKDWSPNYAKGESAYGLESFTFRGDDGATLRHWIQPMVVQNKAASRTSKRKTTATKKTPVKKPAVKDSAPKAKKMQHPSAEKQKKGASVNKKKAATKKKIVKKK